MKGFWGTVIKEMLLLVRDIPGMILLFAMPMILILVITLTQQNAYESFTDNKMSILFVDEDHEELGLTIEKGLTESGYFDVVKEIDGKPISTKKANELIASGSYQIGITIPAGSTVLAKNRADAIIISSRDTTQIINKSMTPLGQIELSFDPTIRQSYKSAVTASLKRLIQAAEFQILLNRFFALLPDQLNEQAKIPIKRELNRQLKLMEAEFNKELKERMGEYAPEDLVIEAPEKNPDVDLKKDFGHNLEFDFKTDSENLAKVKEVYAQGSTDVVEPSLVQNNVPAFALFAMFFIVIPLAGSMLTERNQGTYNRLRTLPVTYLSMLSGKIFVYIIVCLSQLGIMIFTGIQIIPAISDLPALEMGDSYFSIFFAAVSCALAAIGFGLLVGTIASSQSQAGMFGSFMVVILAILGGIFLPVYMMPEPLKYVSMLSPLRWGIDSFLVLFVRNGNLTTIWDNILLLNLFFVFALFIAMRNFVKKK
jgi:ABC-2 type transport system permease protein